MTKADADHRSEHSTFPPFAFFAFVISLREEIGARKSTSPNDEVEKTTGRHSKASKRASRDAAHFAAIAAEDATAEECDGQWDKLIARWEIELQRRRAELAR